MINETKIEWTDYTWNPITGCLGPRGDGVRCPYCYANKLAQNRLKSQYLRYNLRLAGNADDPFAPRFWANRLWEPSHRRRPAKIFVCDMGELFGTWVPDITLNLIFDIIKKCPHHTFQLLTKQPQNLPKFSPYPNNCWVGITVTTNSDFLRAIDYLPYVKASIKFISFEPLLAPIPNPNLTRIDWIIIGGQSGKDKFYPPLKWIVDIEDAAEEAGIPVFEKSNLVPYPNPKFLRQEFPASLLASSNLDPQLRQNAKERRELRIKYALRKGE